MKATPLIATLVAGFALAFILGALARRLRLPPLVGYLLAGVMIGPATPGFVADPELALELAEIGVILLMFGVGLHFSLRDLLAVRLIAIPGALGQIAVATLLGAGLGWALGWPLAAGLVFGLALSVASTVVLLRALEERRLLETERGRIAVGWLIVEDLAMVLALVLIPVLAETLGDENGGGFAAALAPLGATLAKVAAFVALMLVVGRRAIPWALHRAAGSGSRELFTLAVLAVALGIAYGSAYIFGVSFALGAFFAGMVLAESELSHRAAEDSLPLRDAFAVLFFVSVGMLLSPAIVVEMPLATLATALIVILGKSIAAYAIVRLLHGARDTAATVSASLAQIGEFSFILATLGLGLGLLPPEGQDLIIAGAILSIVANPLLFALVERFAPTPRREAPEPARAAGHAVIAGYGYVGRRLAGALRDRGAPFVVIDDRAEREGALAAEGGRALEGNAADDAVLAEADVAKARVLLVAIPSVFEAGQVVAKASQANPDLLVIARAETEAEAEHLRAKGADLVILGRTSVADAMLAAAYAPRVPAG